MMTKRKIYRLRCVHASRAQARFEEQLDPDDTGVPFYACIDGSGMDEFKRGRDYDITVSLSEPKAKRAS